MEPDSRYMNKPAVFILLAALVALVAKLYCAATTTGTNDVNLFVMFGRIISESGLTPLYGATRMFNHTPLVGTATALIYDLSGDDLKRFAFLLRLPSILADSGTVLLLLRIRQTTGQPPWWALALLALSPVSFMVSGYHGNVDSIMVFLLVLAALMCVEGQPGFCGLSLGLACNVKVVPLLLVPALFFFWLHRRKALPFALAAAVTVLVGWALPLVTTPRAFIANVLGYSSYWGSWGITYSIR